MYGRKELTKEDEELIRYSEKESDDDPEVEVIYDQPGINAKCIHSTTLVAHIQSVRTYIRGRSFVYFLDKFLKFLTAFNRQIESRDWRLAFYIEVKVDEDGVDVGSDSKCSDKPIIRSIDI